MKILIVAKDPTHQTNAGNRYVILTQAEKLKSLGLEVHFLYIEERPLKKERWPEYDRDLALTADYWKERFHLYRVGRLQKFLFNLLYRFRMAFCHFQEGVDDHYPCGLTHFVNRLDAKMHFDICLIHYYDLSRLLTRIHIPVKALMTHDCFAYKNLVVGERILHINAHSEAKAMQRADAIFAIQEEEAAYFSLLAPRSRVYDIFSIYSYHPQKIAGNHDIVFLSGPNRFNINGIKWFVKEIFPAILTRFPDAQLLIGGRICRELPEFKGMPGISLEGSVDSPELFYAKADIAINPVYQGTGLKIKTLEAVSYDKVTIVHPHSMRGLYDKAHAPMLVAENASEWLSHLEKVWGDRDVIASIKLADAEYMESMQRFIDEEYQRFLKDITIDK